MPEQQGDIVDVAVGAGSFKTLVAAVKAAGLVDTLKGKGPFTVFAPTDDAFAKLPEGTVASLLKDKARLTQILTYHVVPGAIKAKALVKKSWASTAQGQSLRVEVGDDGVRVDGARVVKADIAASNGVIHVIDSVILPRDNIVDTAVGTGKFKTLVKAVQAAGLAETLAKGGPFTVFAPTDAAFGAIPSKTLKGLLKDKSALSGILTYHVVPGRLLAKDVLSKPWIGTVQGQSLRVEMKNGKPMIDGARIVATDVIAGNGIVHVIDAVVTPRPSIVETAVKAGSFKTLVAAVKAAGLVDALSGKGPFTVFAPTDEAFAKLPEGTVESLLNDIPKLKAILTYHVVPGRILSSDIPATVAGDEYSARPKTLQGQKLTVKKSSDGVQIDGANVVKADILTGNGVIHVIDRVILPR
jgi:uncharacterized surface protein with fasciclin (FAS1) repeats